MSRLTYNHAKFWTRTRTEKLLVFVGEGLCDATIAARLGCTRAGVIRRLKRLRKAGVEVPARGHFLTRDLAGRFGPAPTEEERAAIDAEEGRRANGGAANACALHLADLVRAHPAGPPPDVFVRRGLVPRQVRTLDLVLP